MHKLNKSSKYLHSKKRELTIDQSGDLQTVVDGFPSSNERLYFHHCTRSEDHLHRDWDAEVEHIVRGQVLDRCLDTSTCVLGVVHLGSGD